MEFHSYRYRAARYAANFPVLLETRSPQSRAIQGHCTDVSEDGMAAELNGQLPLGCTVTLGFTLPPAGTSIRVTARVTHRCADHHGFAFLYSSAAEANEVRRNISSFIRSGIGAQLLLHASAELRFL